MPENVTESGDDSVVRPVAGPPPSSSAELSTKLQRLRSEARTFARLPPAEKARLLRIVLSRFLELSERMVELGARAKGVDPRSELAGEEWFGGPVISIRALRVFAEALEDVARFGAPRIEPARVERLPNGRTCVRTVPHGVYDRVLYPGWSSETWLDTAVSPRALDEHRARFYEQRDPDGKVVLVLGAGNVGSISVLDVLHHSFVAGAVCLLKMSPVNAYLGPLYELAFEPLVSRGFLALAHGGPDVGAYLVDHPSIDAVHVTGSAETHDRIVWGPPGADREERQRSGRPLLQKPITSELGNIGPVLIVPGEYTDGELDSVVWKITGAVAQNASCNCVAAKMLVMPRGFSRRTELLERLRRSFERIETRLAYYPGSAQRYESLLSKVPPESIRRIGDATRGRLPWTLVEGLEPASGSALFEVEPFCTILSEVLVGSSDPVEYLASATRFANETLWGTLNATIIVPRRLEQDSRIGRALDAALTDLRYGTIGVNLWPAASYGLGQPPWGGHPSSTLANVQSGIGFGHNSLMLERVEKVVCRAPLRGLPEFVWYPGHRRLADLGRAVAHVEAQPKPAGVLRAGWALLRR